MSELWDQDELELWINTDEALYHAVGRCRTVAQLKELLSDFANSHPDVKVDLDAIDWDGFFDYLTNEVFG